MFKKFILIICISVIGHNISNAQYKKSYTLGDAISEALKNNSELVNAKFDRLKASEKVSETYNENLLPNLTLNSQFVRAFKKQVIDIFGQRYEVQLDNTITNVFQASEPIPVLGTPVFSGIRIAEYYANLQNENVSAVETKIKTDVKKAFNNVLFLNEVVNLNKLSLQNAEENFAVVELKYKNGVQTEFDFLRAKVKVENIKPELSKSENNLIISKKLLKNTIGLKQSEEVDVIGNLSYDSNEVFGNTDVVLKKISEENVSVRQLNISKLINKELITIDNANFLPKLFVFGQWQIDANENDGRSIFKYRYYNVLNAGIGLSWNLNFFRNTFKKRQSEIELKKTEETISDLKQKLRISGQNTLLKLDDAKKRIIAQYETVKLAERGYELANLSFKNGVLNQIDVLDAEFTLNQTKLAYLQAIYDYQNSKAELEGLLEK